ncbi:MAG: transposase [Patescibacteria group bacterium]
MEKQKRIVAVAYAPKGTAFAATQGGKGLTTLTLKESAKKPSSREKKIEFIQSLDPQHDVLVVENGGASDYFALFARARGIEVLRFPTFVLGGSEHPAKKDDAADALDRSRAMALLNQHGVSVVKAEKSNGTETGTILTLRKARAMAMCMVGIHGHEDLRPMTEGDVTNLRLKLVYRSYVRSFKATMRAYQGVLQSYRDQALIAQAFADTENDILEQLFEDLLGGEANETERADFFALIGKTFGDEGLPAQANEEDIAKLIGAFLDSDKFRSTIFDRLKAQKKAVERALQGGKVRRKGTKEFSIIPANDVFKTVFEPIDGCGPLIAARIIAAVVDIRRFKSLPALKAYAGYHHFEDGSRARRVAGKVSNWNTDLKQGVYLFCDQTVKNKKSSWNAKLERRKAFELYKLLVNRQQLATEAGLDLEVVPASFMERTINGVQGIESSDFATLSAHILTLQNRFGVAFKGNDEADEQEDDGDDEESKLELTKAEKDFSKKLKGLKGAAHQKALRWLGQQFLKHVYNEWTKLVTHVKEEPTSTAAAAE